MFTQPEIVPEGPRAVRPRLSWPAATVAFTVVACLAIALGVFLLPSTVFLTKHDCIKRDGAGECVQFGAEERIEYAVVPADAQAVQPRMKITGLPTPGGDGSILFVTIRQPTMQLLDWFAVRRNPAADLYSHEDLFGSETRAEQRTRSFQMMRTAKDVAEYVALAYAGHKPQLIEGDVLVEQIVCMEGTDTSCTTFAPADAVLDPGDKIVRVDGTPVKVLEELRTLMAGKTPGAEVTLDIERDGKASTVTVTTLASPADPTRAVIGFFPVDTSSIKLPEGVKVEITTDQIGGPSAGLAFTLALIDQLTEGNLLDGDKIAVTGTIALDGTVGPIGGLASKVSAVKQAGVKVFLVPESQGEADLARARRVAGDDVTIIPVATLQQAIDELQKLGGEPPKPVVSASSTP